MFLFVLPVRARSLVVGLLVFDVVMGVAGDGLGSGGGCGRDQHRVLRAPRRRVRGVRLHAHGVYVAEHGPGPAARRECAGCGRTTARHSAQSAAPRARRRSRRRRREEQGDDRQASHRRVTPSPRRAEARADELDRVLDKISQQGIDSLTSGRAQRARGDVEATCADSTESARVTLANYVSALARARRATPATHRTKKEPPGMSRGAMPPRRSRGGDDQRIAPAQLPICAALQRRRQPRLFPRRSSLLKLTHDLHRRAPIACILSRMPRPELLETFPNPYPDRDYEIAMECAEFTALCPLGGIESGRGRARGAARAARRTSGRSASRTCPANACLELKSLKLYLWSFQERRDLLRAGRQPNSG